jgi:RNA polymerase sigma-70 factor, ECF subfamily
MTPRADPDDSELIERSREGDHLAFREIVERYEGRVAATIIGMLGRGAEAEDAGQETFIRLYQSLGNFRGEASLGTYVTRIAMNQALKMLKRRQSWRARFFSRDDEQEASVEPEVEQPGLEEAERAHLIHRVLMELKAEYRAVIVLRMLEERSTREVAEILEIPEGTVMSRLKRGLDRMERRLGPLLNDDEKVQGTRE